MENNERVENQERKLIGVTARFEDGSEQVIDCSTEDNTHVVLLTFEPKEDGNVDSYISASPKTLIDSVKLLTMHLAAMYNHDTGSDVSPIEMLLNIAFGGEN